MKPKPLSKEQIIAANSQTQSAMSAARYLHVSYQHYRKYAKLYGLLEGQKNQCGKGIPKFLKDSKKQPALKDIIEGRVPHTSFTPDKLKYRLIEEGYLKEECSNCGFNERRILDYKMPLLMYFKDGNKANYSIKNLELLCYNCFFLTIGDIFTNKEVKKIESHQQHTGASNIVNFEIDDYHLQRLKELGLGDNDEDELNQYISRI